jgi:hypothetical protein
MYQAAKAIGGTGRTGGSGPPIIPIRGDDVFGNDGEHPPQLGQISARTTPRRRCGPRSTRPRGTSGQPPASWSPTWAGSGSSRWPSWSAPNAALTTSNSRNQAQRRGRPRRLSVFALAPDLAMLIGATTGSPAASWRRGGSFYNAVHHVWGLPVILVACTLLGRLGALSPAAWRGWPTSVLSRSLGFGRCTPQGWRTVGVEVGGCW